MPDIDYGALDKALLDATRQTLAHIQALTVHERLYTFGLYVHDEMSYVLPTANTEEGLLARASLYVETEGESIAYWAKRLRWSPADWKYHCEGAHFFKEVEAILDAGWREVFLSSTRIQRRSVPSAWTLSERAVKR